MDAEGRPVVAQVKAVPSIGASLPTLTSLTMDGRFTIGSLAACPYSIEANAMGGRTGRATVKPGDGSRVRIVVRRQ